MVVMGDSWRMEVENSMPSLATRKSVNDDVSNIVGSISMQSQAPIFLCFRPFHHKIARRPIFQTTPTS